MPLRRAHLLAATGDIIILSSSDELHRSIVSDTRGTRTAGFRAILGFGGARIEEDREKTMLLLDTSGRDDKLATPLPVPSSASETIWRTLRFGGNVLRGTRTWRSDDPLASELESSESEGGLGGVRGLSFEEDAGIAFMAGRWDRGFDDDSVCASRSQFGAGIVGDAFLCAFRRVFWGLGKCLYIKICTRWISKQWYAP